MDMGTPYIRVGNRQKIVKDILMKSWTTKSILVNALCAIGLILLSVLITPKLFSISKYKIPSSSIRFVETNQSYLMNDYIDPALALPHRKQFLPTQGHTPRRYNFNFDEAMLGSSPQSLYIPSTSLDVTSLINGIPFEVSRPSILFAPGFGQDWYVQDVPRLMFTPHNNRVDLHYPTDEFRSGLRSIYLGPTSEISKVANHQEKWMYYLPRAGVLLAILSAFLCMSGMLFGKSKRAFAMLGIISAITFFQFLMTFLEIGPNFSTLLYLLKIFPAVMILISLAIWSRLTKREDNVIKLVTPAMLGMACLGPAFGLATMVLPYPMPAPLLGTTLSLSSMIPLIFLWPLTTLFQDLQERRSIVGALRSKVSEQEKMLDEKSRMIALEMQKRAVLEERQRFTRDIHDGIGGQLLTLLLRIRSGKLDINSVASEIQNGINDLRLIVDSMDHTGDNLEMALSTFKARTVRQLEAAGIKLKWQQTADLNISMTSTRDILNLYRFMQEAVTNVIHHAKAETLCIAIEDKDGILAVELLDDGIGLKTEEPQAGKGLNNLRERARNLQGNVKFGTGIKGEGFGVYFTKTYIS